jgi:hypothetical protein
MIFEVHIDDKNVKDAEQVRSGLEDIMNKISKTKVTVIIKK